LVGKFEREISLGRLRCKWEDYIKIDLKERMQGSPVIYISESDMGQRRALVTPVKNLQCSQNAGTLPTECY
jgi:hypothetical protein